MRGALGAADLADAAGALAWRLRARRAEIEEAIFARVRAVDSDRAGPSDTEYMAGLRVAVTAAVDYDLRGIEGAGEDSEVPAPIPAAAVAQAHRAAREGVSLDTVLLRYTAGYALLEDFLVEEAENSHITGQQSVLRHILRAHAAVLERLTSSVAREFKCELQRSRRSPEQRRAELVRRLLAGESLSGAGSAAAAIELEYELEAEHLGVIARGPGARELLRGLTLALDRRLLSITREKDTVWAWLAGQRALQMRDLQHAVSSQEPGMNALLAVGEPACGLEGWRLTHQQAQAALLVALRRPQRLTRYADVALLATALKDQALAKALIDIYIAPLKDLRNGSPILRQTLHAYLLTERNVSSTAAALGVARKTVESRLRTIEVRLGRSLHPCPAELEIALHLDELAVPATTGISTTEQADTKKANSDIPPSQHA